MARTDSLIARSNLHHISTRDSELSNSWLKKYCSTCDLYARLYNHSNQAMAGKLMTASYPRLYGISSPAHCKIVGGLFIENIICEVVLSIILL